MNYFNDKEQRHSLIAQSAANRCKRELMDPTEALMKAASDNALNAVEIEDVCAKLNHILFQEKFAEDKLAVFNAAKYDANRSNSAPSMGETKEASYSPADNESRIRDGLQKRAEELMQQDPIMEGAAEKIKEHEFNRFLEQATANASEISAHHMAIDRIVSEMKQRILSLFREGVPLEDVYSTVLMAVGESNAPAVQDYFMNVIEELKQEGFIPQDQTVQFTDPEKIACDYAVDRKLSKLASEAKDNIDLTILKEAAHKVCLDGLTAVDRFDLAEKVSHIVGSTRYIDVIDKIAMPAGGNAGTQKPPMQKPDGVSKRDIMQWAMMAAAGPAIAMAIEGGKAGYESIKKSSLKKKLPNMFPELQNIDEQQYNHLYDTISALDPGLLSAPYALAEMIKRYSTYGTIDTGNILQLQGAGKRQPMFGDLVSKPTAAAISDVVKRQSKVEDDMNKVYYKETGQYPY